MNNAHSVVLKVVFRDVHLGFRTTDVGVGAYEGTCLGAGLAGSVVRATDLLSKGRGFESRRPNFLLQGHLSVLTLVSVSVPPPFYRSSW